MERNESPSLSTSGHEEKADEADRIPPPMKAITDEGEKAEEQGGKDPDDPPLDDLVSISADIDRFLSIANAIRDGQNQNPEPPEIPGSAIDRLVSSVEDEISAYESRTRKWFQDNDDLSLLDAVDGVSKLTAVLAAFPSEPMYAQAARRTGALIHRTMPFLEEEFRSLLEYPKSSRRSGNNTPSPTSWRRPPPASSPRNLKHDLQPNSPALDYSGAATPHPPLAVEKLTRIAAVMISAGYETECYNAFSIARSSALDRSLSELGFIKISADGIQRMPWESLEGEIVSWIKALRQSVTVSFPYERRLAESVFSSHPTMASGLFSNLARGIIIRLLNFAEAVATTKCSAEKLFKVLDMHETLRDMMSEIDGLLPAGEAADKSASPQSELNAVFSSTRNRLGEAAVTIFCDLESSIKADVSKTPVPGGAVHPLTRYAMNYLEYACEYKNTLGSVFQQHQTISEKPPPSPSPSPSPSPGSSNGSNVSSTTTQSPFAMQLIHTMDLLFANLESKTKLYKDPALSCVFMMNNERYIMKKTKGSAGIGVLVGDAWCRKRSSEMRQYHKNYQRESWAKVLACFRDEGLHVKGGSVSKAAVRERLKSFNTMFEAIHRTQSAWVVSDEQMRSELRVSVSAVLVPAYRSFLGRFRQYLNNDKDIKYGSEELEDYIHELFDGNPSCGMRKKS